MLANLAPDDITARADVLNVVHDTPWTDSDALPEILFTYRVFHAFVADPRSYVSRVAGVRLPVMLDDPEIGM